MRILHLCWGLEPTNGAANIARLVMGEQRAEGHEVSLVSRPTLARLRQADQLWFHCGWYWRFWLVALWAKRHGKPVRWMPEGCYDPVRLRYHGWKKRLAGPFERWALRQAEVLIATCPAEMRWICSYVGRGCPRVEFSDIKRFFGIRSKEIRKKEEGIGNKCGVNVLYLGRPHPLKGVEYLERAVSTLNSQPPTLSLRLVADHSGEALERDWEWCDVLCLPTLSDNFGLVVAEALERGKWVIVTDGAPAWEDFDGRLVYVRGFRDAAPERRVELLRDALKSLLDRLQ